MTPRPGVLLYQIRTVTAPRSNVSNIRRKPPYDWEKENMMDRVVPCDEQVLRRKITATLFAHPPLKLLPDKDEDAT